MYLVSGDHYILQVVKRTLVKRPHIKWGIYHRGVFKVQRTPESSLLVLIWHNHYGEKIKISIVDDDKVELDYKGLAADYDQLNSKGGR